MTAQANTNRPEPSPARGLNALFARMSAGEEAALGQLYDATAAWVHGLAIRILHDQAAAEEVTLDVFHHAWHQASRFDPQRGNAHTWLLTIARNRAIDRLRSRELSRRCEAPLEEARQTMDPRPDPQAQAMLADRGARVRRALAALGPEQREVIELAFFEGLSHGRIAQQLDQPLGTVKTRIRLGIRHLADKLLAEDRP